MSTIPRQIPQWTTEKEKAIYEIALKHISQFELYDPSHLIYTRNGSEGFTVSYRTADLREEPSSTRSDILVAKTARIDWIGIAPELRHLRYGFKLYRRIEDIFIEAGCEALELTPMRSRDSLLLKNGFERRGTNLVPTYRKMLMTENAATRITQNQPNAAARI